MTEPKNLNKLLEDLCIPHETLVSIKLQVRDLLQRFKDEEERKLEETKKHGAFFSDYSNKEYEIYMYAYVMSRIDDLGRGIIVDIKSKRDPKKSGLSGKHMGIGTDEFCEEK